MNDRSLFLETMIVIAFVSTLVAAIFMISDRCSAMSLFVDEYEDTYSLFPDENAETFLLNDDDLLVPSGYGVCEFLLPPLAEPENAEVNEPQVIRRVALYYMPEGSRKLTCRRCHDRKVRCDGETPCSNCIKRGEACYQRFSQRNRFIDLSDEEIAGIRAKEYRRTLIRQAIEKARGL